MASRSLRRTAALWFGLACAAVAASAQEPTKVKTVGTVSSINAKQVGLKTDAGANTAVQVLDSTRILRAAPGQKDLTNAPSIHLEDVHPGDRMLVSGTSTDAGHSIAATTIVVMSSSDLAQRRTEEQRAWQSGKRGVVTGVDAAGHTVTIKSPSGPQSIKLADSASLLRYRNGSGKFSDAQAAQVDQIKVGDQLQAKGKQDPAGAFVADTVVFGTFINVAGRIQSLDPATTTVTVNDLFTKKPVALHITPDSQLRQLPAMIAQRIAMQQRRGQESNGMPNRPIDFQQVIARSPNISIADLHKGDAIIAVAGSESAHTPAFYLVDGVEPILTASPGAGGAAALLASWNLSGSAGESE